MAISQKISSRLYLKATEDLPDVSMLPFRDPKRFVTGKLHRHLESWSYTASPSPRDLAPQVLHWVKNSVDVHEFFQQLKGCYKREAYYSPFPPQNLP